MDPREKLFDEVRAAETELLEAVEHLAHHIRGIVQNPIELSGDDIREWKSQVKKFGEEHSRALADLRETYRAIKKHVEESCQK